MANNDNNSMSMSRYNYGVTTLLHKNFLVTTTLGSSYDMFLDSLASKESRPGKVPSFVKQRPVLISNVFYDTPGYWWYIMQFNGITDPFEELLGGAAINIPAL